MRLITTFNKEVDAKTFSIALARDGIPNNFEKKFDPETKQFIYYIWIIQEATLERAKNWLELYKESPSNPQFKQVTPITGDIERSATTPDIKNIRKKRFDLALHLTTSWIIILCAVLFVFSVLEAWTKPAKIETANSLYRFFLFSSTSDWPGFYTLLLNHLPLLPSISTYPLFSSIKQGEIWRLVTPALLHGNFIHLFFNMLCLWVLGQQVEERLGRLRYVLITLLFAIITNTAQYLMTGPLFVGYSGVIAGLIGFIWMRQKNAPWEGYNLSPTAALFFMVFIGVMFAWQVFSFIVHRFQINLLLTIASTNIANTAHIAGVICGILFAKIPIFYRKVS